MPALKRQTHAELVALQRLAGRAIMRKLGRGGRTDRTWDDGRPTAAVASTFIKPNDRLTSIERIEIYNRQYWFRLIDCMYEDFPAVLAVLGPRRFNKVIEAYLDRYPSRSYTLRNLGCRLEQFLAEEPALTAPRTQLAIEAARFNWAQVVAFDGAERPAYTVDELLGANPARLRLGLQPYVTLLSLGWPLDDWSIALKEATQTLRGEASNAVDTSHDTEPPTRRVKLPKPQAVHLAVHRHDNSIWYKRLPPAAFDLLARLRDGATLAAACEGVPADQAGEVQRWFATWTTLGWFCRRK